jgi:1-deoxyxylulose-5-phosphate synthase
VPVGEVMDALNREVAVGHVRHLGASNWSVARLAEANQYAAAHGLHGFVISQVQWSLAEPDWAPGPDPVMRFVTADEIAFHLGTGLPIAAYSSCAAGYFTRECGLGGCFDGLVNRERHARACQLAEARHCTPTQIALAWLLHQAPLTIPILGTLDVEHLREALGALDVPLTTDEVKWLRDG